MAETQGFAPGDIVELRSGGPQMTVRWTGNAQGETGCDWWNDADSKFVFDRFFTTSLKLAETD